MPLLSVITAFYNEELNLAELRRRLESLAGELGPNLDCEFILVDDHSTDGSDLLALEWARQDARVRYVRLARNAGSHAAFTAGLRRARGDCAVLLAADLQDPPDLVPQLVKRWRDGYDVVWAVRAAREGIPWTTQLTADIYYGLMRCWALPNMPRHGADFLLLDRRVIDALHTIPEKNTSLLGMVLWLGFRQTEVEYVKQARFAGVSKWTLRKKVKLFTDSLLSFSTMPMQIVGMMASGMTILALTMLAGLLGIAALGGSVAGWAWVLLGVLGVGAAQMAALTILGAYLWRTFDEARRRPSYVVEKTAGPDHPGGREAA